MFIPVSLSLLLAASLAFANHPETHRVYVGVDDAGNPALQYSPAVVHAEVGDFIQFHFKPKAHSVTEGSFQDPCISNGGFDTGLVPVDPQKTLIWSPETFRTFEVKDKNPRAFHCIQQNPKPHCGQGMVFALNPTDDATIENLRNLAISQNGTVPPSQNPPTSTTTGAPPAPTGSSKVHEVQVGSNGKFVYDPPSVVAARGDKVLFRFNPKNHTVTESSHMNPCRRKTNGFDSGFRAVQPNQAQQETFEVTVGDPAIPQFAYCRQGLGTNSSHCERLGPMVFAINPAKDGPQSLAAVQQAALATQLGAAPLAEPNTTAKVHDVQVGPNGKFVYDPPSIIANQGEIVRFHFNPKNHTVSESSFTNPCRKKDGGFESGFRPIQPNQTQTVTFDITVGDPAVPQFGYCRQGLGTNNSHCERLGPMVFAINPAKDGPQSLAVVQQVAFATKLGAAPLAEPSTGNSKTMNVTLAAGAAAVAFASVGGAVLFFIRRRSYKKAGAYGQIDEATAPLGDRSALDPSSDYSTGDRLGEFQLPLSKTRSLSPQPHIGMSESRLDVSGAGGERPLLSRQESA